MKNNKYESILKYVKATIIGIIVALMLSLLILVTIYYFFRDEILMVADILSLVIVSSNSSQNETIATYTDDGKALIEAYPEYGSKYADISIPSCNINLPVYFGDTLEILDKGVGHNSGSYFPGEGGAILYLAHNTKRFLYNLQYLKVNDEINIKTTYGQFKYIVYEIKIVDETDISAFPIQREKENFMMYTCYPFGYMGYTTKRMAVYAYLDSYKY